MTQTATEPETVAAPEPPPPRPKVSPGTVLILGAGGGIARALAHRMASQGNDLLLAGRDREELERGASDLRLRYGVRAAAVPFDAEAFETHPAFFRACVAAARANGEGADPPGARNTPGTGKSPDTPSGLAGVILCHGYMAEQPDAQADFALARRMIDVNFTSAVSVLELAAAHFESLGRGYVCALSSVAGDRGRQSNYLYGSTKAALSTYLQGLRSRLFKRGVFVTTVKPGFVDTAMTWGRKGVFLVASPEKVAKDIARAIRRRKSVVYTPWFWWGIMSIICAVPEWLFKRTKL